MSLLRRLLGRRTPRERLEQARILIGRGEPGLAKLELEAALAAPDLGEPERDQAKALLSGTKERLARARLEEGQALGEAGELDAAREALALALSLAEPEPLRREIEQAQGALRRRTRDPGPGEELAGEDDEEEEPGEDATEEDEVRVPEREEGHEGEGDLSALELALLAFPEAEAQRLLALGHVEPALGEALSLVHEGDAPAALARWASVREPALSDPLARRERARATLLSGDAAEAAGILEEILPTLGDDPEVHELLMEAHLVQGKADRAAESARELLRRGAPRDFAALLAVLHQAGATEEALGLVDRALDGNQRSVRLWELRATLCAALASEEGVVEADERALELYRASCGACGSQQPSFPLSSARRLAERLAAGEQAPGDRDKLRDLLRLLLANDPGEARRWRRMLRALDS